MNRILCFGRVRYAAAGLLALAFGLVVDPSQATNEITKSVVASGGSAVSDHYAVRATLGEPLVMEATSTHQGLRAGFWRAIAAQLGDMNCDGVVNAGDIPAFVLSLISPSGYTAAYPTCSPGHADMNNDGSVDGADIQFFVRLLVAP